MTSSTPLLVPVGVQAMVLNSKAVNFIRAQMDYDKLSEDFQDPTPQPFQEDELDFATHLANHGVYLRWTLPRALRHATRNGAGVLAWPFVPNRWLVVRVYRATGGSPELAAWMVESDHLGGSDGCVAFVDPTKTASLTPTRLGRKVPVAAWREPTDPPPYFLKAVAEANPAFAAYQPFHQNVFSLFDPLGDDGVGAGTLSYFVQGWYSDPSADILAARRSAMPGSAFADVLAALGWSAPAAAAGDATTLFHGGAFGVEWLPQSAAPPSPKDTARPCIAVGNTGVDAVVAFARAAFDAQGPTPPHGLGPDQAGDLLEAFQHNLLSALGQPGGQERIEQRVRSQWFGAADAGIRWTIVDAASAPGSTPREAPDPAELARESAWLAALNDAQTRFDATVRDLMGARRRLFELWWKHQVADAISDDVGEYPWNTSSEDFSKALDPSRGDGPAAEARRLMAELAALADQVPRATGTTTLTTAAGAFASAKGLPSTRELKAVAEPRFWSAADPVVVLSNTSHATTLDPPGSLACRWPADVLTALRLTAGAGGPTFTAEAALVASRMPAVPLAGLPPMTSALFAEFLLLDPSDAALIADAAGQSLDPEQLSALAQNMANPVAASGSVPALLAAYPWSQPWQPLFLDWSVTWYPVSFQGDSGGSNWDFDGRDYDLVSTASQEPFTLEGRSVLTPKPSFEFRSRLDQFITENPASPATAALRSVEHLVDTVDRDWDFLSQTLSGLTTQLASWSVEPYALPVGSLAGDAGGLADLIGAQASVPDPQLAERRRRSVPPPSTFEGLRGGQFAFSRLTVVDVFGQTLELVTAQDATQTQVITAQGVEVNKPVAALDSAGLVQLPPRLLQPARLNFRFSQPSADASPILGWLLANHVDGALAVYGQDGTLYGELTSGRDGDNQPAAFWWTAPETPFPTLAGLVAAEPQLGGLLAGLQRAGPAALRDFLRSVDETLWTVDPLGDRSDADLSVLLGRPLAVVDATLSLELQAEAWSDPAWPYTFADPRPRPRFLDYAFPVKLGDLALHHDGLLGYCLDGDYGRFNAVASPGSGDRPSGGYVVEIGPGNWIPLAFAAKGPGPARALTLVMDPRAAVHAQCGILPTKAINLVPEWVDAALAAMRATFRMGPVLAEMRRLIPEGQTTAVDALLTPRPADRRGGWLWRQAETDGSWPSTAVGSVDAMAAFPASPPILRDGLLQLTGGLRK